MIVTFCGHSDFVRTAEHEKAVYEILEKEIGYEEAEIYLGGYGAFDQFAYGSSSKFKMTHPNVSLVFVAPYLYGLSKYSEYDDIIYPSLENVPKKFAITYRNKYMIENSDVVIAYVNRLYGGAYKSYSLAEKQGKKIYNLSK